MQKKDQIVSELTVYTLKLTSARDVDHIIEVVEGSDQDAWDAGYGIDSGHGTPDDVEIIARRPAAIEDIEDKDHAHIEIACLAEADREDAAYYAGVSVSDEAREIIARGLYEAAVGLMDDDLRERLHAELAPCTKAAFLSAYMAAHKAAFGKDFVVA